VVSNDRHIIKKATVGLDSPPVALDLVLDLSGAAYDDPDDNSDVYDGRDRGINTPGWKLNAEGALAGV
jgi:hypothetical protein